MNVVDAAKEQVRHLAEKLTHATEPATQALTVSRPRPDVVELFRDPVRLSQVFGDIAEVQAHGPDRQRWTFLDGPTWECVVTAEGDSRLRFTGVNAQDPVGLTLDFRDAPQDRGTEVIAHVSTPAPGVLTGALAFKALYRARALLLTGEIPTIKHNPSARHSDR